MTDPRRVAIDVIARIDRDGAYANVVLPAVLGGSDLDDRDKAFVTELVYGSTRRRRALDHLVDRYLVQDPPPVARAALRIGTHQLVELDTPPHAAVSATVGATPKRFRGLVNAVLRKVAAATADGEEAGLFSYGSHDDFEIDVYGLLAGTEVIDTTTVEGLSLIHISEPTRLQV